MIVQEDGPLDAFINLRTKLHMGRFENGWPWWWQLGVEVTGCVWCMSVWVGAVFTVLPTRVSVPFALSAVAILVDRWGFPSAKSSQDIT